MTKPVLQGEAILCQNAILPRLSYSGILLESILEDLKMASEEADCKSRQLELQRALFFAAESLVCVQKRLLMIESVQSITETIPQLIPVIRTVASQLYGILPSCSRRVWELSALLGSVVMDSASITEARFDFKESNRRSSLILDKVKLIVESKLNKLYPNLGTSKVSDT